MKKNNFKTEILHLEIPFFEWIDGDMELMNELYENYIDKVRISSVLKDLL